MSDPFHHLEPDTRAFALVGKFLWHWAYMENALNDAIGQALRLDSIQKYILGQNIQIRDKIKIAQASVAVSLLNESEKDTLQSTLRGISDFAKKRNMVAHEFFGPSDTTDGAIFLRFVAREKVAFSETTWSGQDFQDAFKKMDNYREQLAELAAKLNKDNNMRLIARALIAQDAHEPASDSGTFLQRLSRQTLNSPIEPTSPRHAGTGTETGE